MEIQEQPLECLISINARFATGQVASPWNFPFFMDMAD